VRSLVLESYRKFKEEKGIEFHNIHFSSTRSAQEVEEKSVSGDLGAPAA